MSYTSNMKPHTFFSFTSAPCPFRYTVNLHYCIKWQNRVPYRNLKPNKSIACLSTLSSRSTISHKNPSGQLKALVSLITKWKSHHSSFRRYCLHLHLTGWQWLLCKQTSLRKKNTLGAQKANVLPCTTGLTNWQTSPIPFCRLHNIDFSAFPWRNLITLLILKVTYHLVKTRQVW